VPCEQGYQSCIKIFTSLPLQRTVPHSEQSLALQLGPCARGQATTRPFALLLMLTRN